MDGLVGFLVLLGLALLAVPVLLVVVLVSQSSLKARVAVLERELAALRGAGAARAGDAAAAAARATAPPASTTPTASGEAPTLAELMRRQAGGEPAAPAAAPAAPPTGPAAAAPAVEPAAEPPLASPAPPPLPPTAPPRPATPRAVPPAPVENPVLRAVRRWFTVGNVPVKIGMLVLLAGVAALLKYASERGLFTLPLELRLAGVAAAALAALGFAWKRRESNRVFALSLQGGAIGVLLLTVYAAARLYDLMPAGAAFALSVLLVAGMGLLAVLQDARALAVFALLAGFLAPVWLSTGGGSHVALFSYYALLNAAIVAIAWFRSWRILNLLGFAFTFGIGGVWATDRYHPELYASTQPFLVLFFLFYLAVPVLFARRQPEGRRDLLDGCLVFGTPLVAFAMQAGLLDSIHPDGSRMPLALCALGLGLLYAGLAWTLLRRGGYAVLGQSHAILAVGFATLAVPLALSARATASVFALEGAGLVWLGLRQGRALPQFSGAALQLLAAGALAIGVADHGGEDLRFLANPTAMGALLVALAGFASAHAMRAAGEAGYARLFYLWGLAWWCGNGVHEIDRFVASDSRGDALFAFAGLTAWLAAEAWRLRPARLLAWTVAAAFVAMPLLALWQDTDHVHPFGGSWGAATWLAATVLALRGLWCLRGEAGAADVARFAWWMLWPLALSLWLDSVAVDAGLAQGWVQAMCALPWLALLALSLWRWAWLAFPREAEASDGLRTVLVGAAVAVVTVGWLQALALPMPSAPLPWLPLLNPAELAQLVALGLVGAWLWSGHAPAGLTRWCSGILAVGGFLLASASTLRTVHHWGGHPWVEGLLSTSLAQTSLTVVWSVLGVIGWIVGSRRGRRGLWLAGALLMGVVLAKLLLVDRQHLGGMLGIVSFIAYGVLCTIVGYLAPAPPRAAQAAEGEANA